jgi:putative nucleotidyltransferase with HDIG domain
VYTDRPLQTRESDKSAMATEQQSKILRRLAHLPPFPPTALQLLTISAEEEVAVGDCERVFKSDPVLATDLLAIANSAAYGLRVRVGSIRHAIALLGLERVKSLAFTVAMQFYMRSSLPAMPLVQRVWSHSVATGFITEALGVADGLSAYGLYTAGLLHDVGRLGLLISEPRYADLLGVEFKSIDDAVAAERNELGMTHTEAGAALARTWGLPTTLCDCIQHHHDAAPRPGHVYEVGQACRVADSLGYSEFHRLPGADHPTDDDLDQELERRNLAPAHLRDQIKSLIGSVWPSNEG